MIAASRPIRNVIFVNPLLLTWRRTMFSKRMSLFAMALVCASCFGLAITDAASASLDAEAAELFGGCVNKESATCGTSGSGCVTISPGVTSCCTGQSGFANWDGSGNYFENMKSTAVNACGGTCGHISITIVTCG